MSKLRPDEIFDQRSYKHKITAQKFGARADAFRFAAYSIKSKANGLFADALALKKRAYNLESKGYAPKSPVWKKVYTLKKRAFLLETDANKLNSDFYSKKKKFYALAEKEAAEHTKFTALKALSYDAKVKNNIPGECGMKK